VAVVHLTDHPLLAADPYQLVGPRYVRVRGAGPRVSETSAGTAAMDHLPDTCNSPVKGRHVLEGYLRTRRVLGPSWRTVGSLNRSGRAFVLEVARERRGECDAAAARPDAQGKSALGVAMTHSLHIEDLDRADQTRMLREVQGRHCRVTLPHLTGADLCVLGGLRHPVCWEPLARAWRSLDAAEMSRIGDTCAGRLVERGLLVQRETVVDAAGPCAHYALSGGLGGLLAARSDPSLVITTSDGSRTPSVTYYGIGSRDNSLQAFVQEIPQRVDDAALPLVPDLLALRFRYWLCSPGVAARVLASWAIRPSMDAETRKARPRWVSFLSRARGSEFLGGRVAATGPSVLCVHGDGRNALVFGPDLRGEFSGSEFSRDGLAGHLAELMNSAAWRLGLFPGQRHSDLEMLPPSTGSRLPGPRRRKGGLGRGLGDINSA
jgi:hypothetical protein